MKGCFLQFHLGVSQPFRHQVLAEDEIFNLFFQLKKFDNYLLLLFPFAMIETLSFTEIFFYLPVS
jgi:hypothetical protein